MAWHDSPRTYSEVESEAPVLELGLEPAGAHGGYGFGNGRGTMTRANQQNANATNYTPVGLHRVQTSEKAVVRSWIGCSGPKITGGLSFRNHC
jgi:hypothetical protein